MRLCVLGPILMLAGCRAPQAPSVDTVRVTAVRSGVSRLQTAFNQGECGAIFDESHPLFRRWQTRETFLDQCAKLRRTLGEWKAFEGHGKDFVASSTVMTSGRARFAAGEYLVVVCYEIVGGQPRLSRLELTGMGRSFGFPLPPSRRQKREREMDPIIRDHYFG